CEGLAIHVLEGAVHVVEAPRLLHAQPFAGPEELPLAHLADGAPGGGPGVVDLARLAPSGRDHEGFRTGRRVLCEGAPGTERLVVGVGEEPEDTWGPPHEANHTGRSAALHAIEVGAGRRVDGSGVPVSSKVRSCQEDDAWS